MRERDRRWPPALAARVLRAKLSPPALRRLQAAPVDPTPLLTDTNGVVMRLTARALQRALDAELAHHHKHNPGWGRLGSVRPRYLTIVTSRGPIQLAVPDTRTRRYHPQIVQLETGTVATFDDLLLALYARCATAAELEELLAQRMYRTQLPSELVRAVADVVLDEVLLWQCWPLQRTYALLYATDVTIPHPGTDTGHDAHLIAGIDTNGHAEALGCWPSPSAATKAFWPAVLSTVLRRGTHDIRVACSGGIPGLEEALATTFPETVPQRDLNEVQYALDPGPSHDASGSA